VRGASRLAIAVTFVIAVAPAAALGQAAEPVVDADGRAAEANALAGAGDFLGAAAAFRAAHALEPRPAFLCNTGVAFYKAKDLPRAQLYLGGCLTRAGALQAEFVASVRQVLAAVEDTLRAGAYAPVDVTVKPETARVTVSAFDAADEIIGARLVWLPRGRHAIAVRADGYETQTVEVVVDDQAQQDVRVELVRAPVAPTEPTTEPPPVGPPPAVHRRSRVPAIAATVATGAVAIGAGAAYLLARGKASDAGEPGLTDAEYDDRVDAARRWQKISWGLAAAAGVGAIASGYLWYRATRPPATTVEIAPSGDGTGATLWLTGRF
jgi:hypothetical protein